MDHEKIIARWLDFEGVTLANQFGWRLLLSGRRAFAVFAGDQVGVKLPRDRRLQLESLGVVSPLIDHEGRTLTEWVAVHDESRLDELLAVSRGFVTTQGQARRRQKRAY